MVDDQEASEKEDNSSHGSEINEAITLGMLTSFIVLFVSPTLAVPAGLFVAIGYVLA